MRRMCLRVGLKVSAVAKQSKHLDFMHPSMLAVREYVKGLVDQRNIEPLLLGNFDQVWSVHYEPPSKVIHKHEKRRGELGNPFSRQRSLKKVLEAINAHMNGEVLPQAQQDRIVQEVCEPVELNAGGNLNPVDNARNARTVTTLSWSNGDMGRAYITLGPGAMSRAQFVKMFPKLRLVVQPNKVAYVHLYIYVCCFFVALRDRFFLVSQHRWLADKR